MGKALDLVKSATVDKKREEQSGTAKEAAIGGAVGAGVVGVPSGITLGVSAKNSIRNDKERRGEEIKKKEKMGTMTDRGRKIHDLRHKRHIGDILYTGATFTAGMGAIGGIAGASAGAVNSFREKQTKKTN